jgi:hypothetical protein
LFCGVSNPHFAITGNLAILAVIILEMPNTFAAFAEFQTDNSHRQLLCFSAATHIRIMLYFCYCKMRIGDTTEQNALSCAEKKRRAGAN